jgi:hypothetical protein
MELSTPEDAATMSDGNGLSEMNAVRQVWRVSTGFVPVPSEEAASVGARTDLQTSGEYC